MNTISNWHDLRQFGIDALTGEACSLSCRMLCDLSASGKRRILDFLGLPPNTQLKENWNSGSGNITGKSVASILLPLSAFEELAAFCLVDTDHVQVFSSNDGHVHGIKRDSKYLSQYTKNSIEKFCNVRRFYHTLDVPSVGLSSQHAMTGRTA